MPTLNASRFSDSHPSSSSSLSPLGTRATMMEQSLAVLVIRYWWIWGQSGGGVAEQLFLSARS